MTFTFEWKCRVFFDFLRTAVLPDDFTETNLQGANLRNYTLEFVRFSRVNLTQANLRGASIWDTGFLQCDFTGANLSGARSIGDCVY